MKKIMMFVAAAICAVATQAAQVDWGSGTMTLPGSTTKAGKDAVTGYLYLVSQSEYNALDFSNPDSVYNTYKAKTATATGNSNKSGIVTLSSEASIGETQYAVIIYEQNGSDPMQYVLSKGYDSVNSLGGQDKIASQNRFSTDSTGWTVKGSDTPGGGTPEPTSGLLLMIGAGVLALRRRVQK